MQAPMTIKQYVTQMRKIPGGRFTMGRNYAVEGKLGLFEKATLFENEIPAHPVDISSFKIGATLVTVGMWREYVRANKHLSMPEVPAWDWIDDHPIVNVSWNDIMGVDGLGGYCAWASRVGGLRLSLPSEAQWEYAAKGGKRDRKYPWGNTWDHNKLWCSSRENRTSTAPVVRTSYMYKSEFGIVDITGNTLQWCYCADAQYRAPKRDRLGYPVVRANPKNEGAGVLANRLRVLRGGSFDDGNPDYFRCASRIKLDPDLLNYGSGFRLSAGPK
jgi:sulfatase modifying factor 1